MCARMARLGRKNSETLLWKIYNSISVVTPLAFFLLFFYLLLRFCPVYYCFPYILSYTILDWFLIIDIVSLFYLHDQTYSSRFYYIYNILLLQNFSYLVVHETYSSLLNFFGSKIFRFFFQISVLHLSW